MLQPVLSSLFTEYTRDSGLTTFKFIFILLWTSCSNLIEIHFQLSVIERLICFEDKHGNLLNRRIWKPRWSTICSLKLVSLSMSEGSKKTRSSGWNWNRKWETQINTEGLSLQDNCRQWQIQIDLCKSTKKKILRCVTPFAIFSLK